MFPSRGLSSDGASIAESARVLSQSSAEKKSKSRTAARAVARFFCSVCGDLAVSPFWKGYCAIGGRKGERGEEKDNLDRGVVWLFFCLRGWVKQ